MCELLDTVVFWSLELDKCSYYSYFLSHIDFHMVFAYNNCKKNPSSQRYDVTERNVVLSNVENRR